MKKTALVAACVLAASAGLAEAAKIEDLKQALTNMSSEFKEAAMADSKIRRSRSKLIKAKDAGPEVRQQAFTEYKSGIADQLEKQDKLVQRIDNALKTADGLDPEETTNLHDTIQSFDTQMAGYESQIGDLQVQAMALSKKEGAAGAMGRLQTKSLNVLRKQISMVRKTKEKLLGAADSNANKEQVADVLKAMKTAAVTREIMLQFEFAMVAQQAEIDNYMGQVKAMMGELGGAGGFVNHIKDAALSDVETTNTLVQVTQQMAEMDFTFPKLSTEELDAAVAEIEAMEDLFPYDVNGQFFYYDPPEDRWYILRDGKRTYLPTDDEALTGRYVRMHEDGYIYSRAPWYAEPKQLTFTADWVTEVQDAREPAENTDENPE